MPAATLTVIIPAYESQSILPRALRSLAAQSCQDFEVLLVSDDGFDYSDMVRAELGERFGHAFTPRLKSGAGVARQTGIALSETAVVGFLGADDEFSPRLIEKLLPLAQAHGAAGSAVLRVDATKPSGGCSNHSSRHAAWWHPESETHSLARCSGCPLCAPGPPPTLAGFGAF